MLKSNKKQIYHNESKLSEAEVMLIMISVITA